MKLILLLIVSLSNCATWTTYGWQKKEIEFTDSKLASKTVLVNVKLKIARNGESLSTSSQIDDRRNEAYVKRLKETYLFKEVKTGLNKADLKLIIDLENNGEGNQLLAFISGLSLLLIPAYAKDEITAKYTFTDGKDKLLKEYKRNISFDTWIQIFLIPIMPFKFPFVEISDGETDLFKSVLDEANKDGILK